MGRTKDEWDPHKYIEFRLYWPYSSGIPCQWMVHQIDALQFITGLQRPRSVVAQSGIYSWRDGRANPDTVTAVFDYGPLNDPNQGFQVVFSSRMANSMGGHRDMYYSYFGSFDANNGNVTPEGGLTDRYTKKGYRPTQLYEGGYLAGQRSSFGFYSVDGVSSMAPAWGGWSGPTMLMSLEGVQEIKLVTSNPSAEFGDAATVYVSTRSGTNDLRGSSFYEHSNHAFNARDFFAAGKPKGPILHEFGGSLGGPVYIPGLYNGKNRTFFFFAYEARRQPQPGYLVGAGQLSAR